MKLGFQIQIKPDPNSYDTRVLVHEQKLRCVKDETTDRETFRTNIRIYYVAYIISMDKGQKLIYLAQEHK
jgi:hypothetical protein